MLVLVAGCAVPPAGSAGAGTGGTSNVSTSPPEVPASSPTGAPAAVPAELLRATRADLDARLAAAKLAGPVRVVVAEAVTWNDGSLGCPKPGMNYTMALVPGYRVVYAVRAGGAEREFAYHAGRHGRFVYCENPGPPPTGNSAI
jgi:hypothetical protein